MSAFLPPKGLSNIARQAGYAAFGACLAAEKVERRTYRLGLRRETYATEYGRAAAEAVWEYLAAQGIEAQRAETGTGSVHESPVAESDAP
jgi:hypothetical protein